MKTIIIDGKTVEISEESYDSFKNQFLKKSYDDVAKELFESKMAFYPSTIGQVFIAQPETSRVCDANNAPNEEQVESLLALNKLCNVAKYLNEDWLPDFNKSRLIGYVIWYNLGDSRLIVSEFYAHISSQVYFKSIQAAQQAIEILGEEEIKKALTLNH